MDEELNPILTKISSICQLNFYGPRMNIFSNFFPSSFLRMKSSFHLGVYSSSESRKLRWKLFFPDISLTL